MDRCYLLVGPKRHGSKGYWLYDKLSKQYEVETFFTRIDDTENPSKYKVLARTIANIFYVRLHAKKKDLVLVYDNDTQCHYCGVLFVLTFSPIVIHKINAMAVNKDRLFSPIKRFFVKLAYKKIYTTVNNSEIAKTFQDFLGVKSEHFIPIPDSISDFGYDLEKITDRSDQGYIFMGGATYRDYPMFVEIARKYPQYQFVAVTFERFNKFFFNASSNVKVLFGLKELDFYQVMAHSRLVFIPLTSDMQGGQMVVMQAALLSKPIITTKTLAIDTYFNANSIYLINIGDIDTACNYIEELMESPDIRKVMGAKANTDISIFSVDKIFKEYQLKLFSIK